MKSTKSTKRAFLLSVMSVLLCVAMLMGTTFAWFTASVTSGNNKIIAGNLDIDVEFTKDGSTWTALENAETVFSDGLWEPGYTEYVTLKITNKGTLALNYKALVTPVSENGGVNVNGESFKLSDYLVFGTTAPASALTTYTRETARAAVGTTAGLNVNALTKTSTLAAGATEYITMVVYMPEEVGNAANYQVGTAAPSIELGIQVLATQLASESDSFDADYDKNAVLYSPYNVGPTYDYYPQIVKTVAVAAGDTLIEAKGKLNSSDAAETTLASILVPQAAVAAGATELTVKVIPQAPTAETVQAAGLSVELNNEARETANFDVKVEGVKTTGNTAAISVSLFVGKGLNNVKVYHNGIEITNAVYNAETGVASFTTTSFSDYTVAYDKAVAAIGDKTYGSLALAIAAVKAGETIVVLKDVEGVAGISIASGKNFTLDFAGHSVSFCKPGAGSADTATQAFQILENSTVTMKNGTIACTEANKTAVNEGNLKPIKMLIQNYADLTLDNMVLDGSNMAHNAGSAGYVMSNNCGNVVIKDTAVLAVADDFAFNSCKYSIYTAPVVTVKGNSLITGKVELSGGNVTLESGVTVNGMISVGENKVGGATGSVLNVNAGATVTASGYAIVAFGANTVNIAGTVNGIVGTNGNAYNAGSVINVLPGAVIQGDELAICAPNGSWNISGGTISGQTAVYFKSTALTISGGKLIATGDAVAYNYEGSGANATGDALVIDSCNYPMGIDAVAITGGEFVSANAKAVAVYTYGTGVAPEYFISGGSFSTDPSAYVSLPYSADKNDNLWTVKQYKWDVQSVVKNQDNVTGTVTFQRSDDPSITATETVRYLTVQNVGTQTDNTTFDLYCGTELVKTGATFTNSFNANDTFLGKNIVEFPAGDFYYRGDSYMNSSEIYFVGAKDGSGNALTNFIANGTGCVSYKGLQASNRATVTSLRVFYFENIVFDGAQQQNKWGHLFLATCYGIDAEFNNVEFKNMTQASRTSVIGVWANDTRDDESYPTKAENVGVDLRFTNCKVTNCNSKPLVQFQSFTSATIAANPNCYSYISVVYDAASETACGFGATNAFATQSSNNIHDEVHTDWFVNGVRAVVPGETK